MNKFLKGAVTAAMGGVMVFAAACTPGNTDVPKPGEKKHNTETRILQLATGALDGNFNPFFYTSGNDGNMISLTQLGMLTMNEKGELVWGEDQSCVTLDFKRTMRTKDGSVTTTGDKEGTTDYEFIIKKGIKFSDGHDLTIKDVLFSLYVNLDSAYTGSSTMYSTDIVGLTKYRTQSPTASSDADFERQFTEAAQERVNAIIDWADNSPTMETTPSDPQVKADLETAKALFTKELESDWTSVYSSFPESYKDSYRFTEAWQAYLFNEGIVVTQTYLNNNGVMAERYDDTNKNGKKDDGELYYTTLDKPYGTDDEPLAQSHIDAIAEATSDAKVSAYMAQHNCTREYAVAQLQREYCLDVVYTAFTEKSNFKSDSFTNPLIYWATAGEVLTEFASQARTAKFEEIKEANGGKLLYTKIDGINTTTTTKDFSNNDLGGTYDVLKITINGIDPKAEYNFAFTVSPLHYYSGTYTDEKGKTVNYVEEFNGVNNFGVATGDGTFFSTILKDPEKNGLPVGAGPYKASDINGTAATNKNSFYANGVVYFMRNDNFHTVGSGIENAKIKYINYKELTDDRIMEALTTQSIDFGMPNANTTNVNLATQYKEFLGQARYRTGGYGYVGINPKFVPEYKVRQAIMKAMDTSMTAEYYSTGLAEVIYRPISKTSWADPDIKTEYPSIAYATSDSEITKLVTDSGYVLKNGIFTKERNVDGMTNAPIGTKLELKFTIAGETTDHPAMQMFRDTRDRLNRLGFKITVANERNALKDMISGNLAVWAAAWASALDPDPYQIYHKDSKATNPNNWNYPQIKQDTAKWAYEWDIIEELSGWIDAGRETLVRDNRKAIYSTCFDLIMDLAVELPTYQRDDLCVYNKTVIDADSLVKNPSHIIGLFDKIWTIDYV